MNNAFGRINMDTQNYQKDKTDNVVSLQKTDDGTIVSVQKKFSARTGEELESEVLAVDIAELITQKAALQEQIDNINVILLDSESAQLIVNSKP